MEDKEIAEYLDQQRWLINNGLMSDSLKNQLFFCGSIVHKDVQAVEVSFEPEHKAVEYKIYVPTQLLKKISKYNKLSTGKSVFDLWRFKRFLKKEGNLNFTAILNRFIKDYCGTKWTVKVEILDFSTYNGDSGSGDNGEGWEFNQSPDT